MNLSETGGELTSLTEGVSFELKPAPLGKRLCAFCVDLGVISAVMYVVFFAFFFLLVGAGGVGAGLVKLAQKGQWKELAGTGGFIGIILMVILIALVLVALLALFDAYFIWYEYKKGATPGKALFGLKVVSLRNSRLTLGQCCLREVIRHVDFLLVLPGLISVLVTRRNQRLGDLAAATLVVHSQEKEEAQGNLYVSHEDFQWFLDAAKPKAVPTSLCQKYLALAYPAFVLRKSAPGEETLAYWEAVAREHLTAELALEREALLLFFAELCFQTTNRRRS